VERSSSPTPTPTRTSTPTSSEPRGWPPAAEATRGDNCPASVGPREDSPWGGRPTRQLRRPAGAGVCPRGQVARARPPGGLSSSRRGAGGRHRLCRPTGAPGSAARASRKRAAYGRTLLLRWERAARLPSGWCPRENREQPCRARVLSSDPATRGRWRRRHVSQQGSRGWAVAAGLVALALVGCTREAAPGAGGGWPWRAGAGDPSRSSSARRCRWSSSPSGPCAPCSRSRSNPRSSG
jgi:hypothetical protein